MHRCGKAYCHCAKPNDPGHAPQIRVLRKLHGKSVAETLSSPAAFRKAQGEVSEFHRFQDLSAELVTSTKRSAACDPWRRTPGAGRQRKKNGCCDHQEIAREIDALLRVIFTARRKTGAIDLEAVEMALRAALQQAGAAGLRQLLRQECPAEPQVPCSCGGQSRYKGMRSKPLLTVLGRAEMRRAYYWCCRCQQGQFSTDAALDVENPELSPGVRRMLTLVGSECSSLNAAASR